MRARFALVRTLLRILHARSDGGYFFTLVARMRADVEAQPANAALNPGRSATLSLLTAIATEAEARRA